MKRQLAFGLGCLLLLCGATASPAAQKQPSPPTSALFYPNEIYLTVEEKLTPETVSGKGRGLVIVLPSQADTASFSVSINDVAANSFYWLDDAAKKPKRPAPLGYVSPNDEPDSERRALLLAIDAIREEMDSTSADLKAAEARIAMWQKNPPRKQELTPDEMLKLDGAFAEHLPLLHRAVSKNTRLMQELQRRMNEAEQKLREYDETRNKRTFTAIVPHDGPETTPVLVRYSYVLPGSCSTAYRLSAFPAKDTLLIEQDAWLYQDTGLAWKDVDIFISTTRRDTTLRPPLVQPWRISLRSKDMPVPAPNRPAVLESRIQMSQVNEAPMAKAADSAYRAPTQEEKGTFRLWSLGKRNVDSGVAVNLPLASDEYKASYYYTIQPSANPKGFLTAELNLEKALELPLGRARFFLDNVSVGEQNISLNGNKAVLFFGTDPQVAATMRDMKRSTGESGFFSKEQNVLWHWEITVKNTRGRAVNVRIEDPIPDATDTAIKVAVESKPKPEEGVTANQLGATKIYRWKYTLQPGETQVIEHKVQVAAPADKILVPGRNK
ncbi:DUF4139 domain-containing protein [Desulfovibrio sp. OttesenSCG-928-O18]|nr:DUF4139 domain-containing protein [Desulfovibrio sp. OttesenSCG-928-O18]